MLLPTQHPSQTHVPQRAGLLLTTVQLTGKLNGHCPESEEILHTTDCYPEGEKKVKTQNLISNFY